jgi:tryptophan 2,3-dioxygenase
MRTDNWLFAAIGPAPRGNTIEKHLREMRAGRPTAVLRSFRHQGQQVDLLYPHSTAIVETARFWLGMVCPRQPAESLKLALRSASSLAELKGISTGAECYDSTLVMIDKDQAEVFVTTDRVNMAKIFHGKTERLHLLATSISLLPRTDLTVDVRSVASYILNGSCLNNHTPFEHVTVLERATHHQFGRGGHHGVRYWQFLPGGGARAKPWSSSAAASELWDLMVQSVSRITSGKRVLLALSGGYDSAVLLGILGAQLKHPNVTCFSYAYGRPKPGSDAEVASRQAAIYGYDHLTVDSYSGGLLRLLDSNVAIGETLRCPSYEIAAFPALREGIGDVAGSIMLFGDECFGKKSYRLRNADDILGANNLKASILLDRIAHVIGAERTTRLRVALDAEYDELHRKLAAFPAADDAKDFLYLDQRLQFSLIPLRTSVAGHWFPVAMPLVSPDILDFMASVPTGYRIDKQLFKATARRFLPDLFRLPRASRGQFHPDFDQEIDIARRALKDAIVTGSWMIDGILDGSDLINLLDDFQPTRKRPVPGTRARLRKWAKAIVVRSRVLEDHQRWLRRFIVSEFALSPGREILMLNLLCLADLLSQPDAGYAKPPINL